MTYRVTRKRITRSRTNHPDYRNDTPPADLDDEVFEVGDVFEPTEGELQAFGDRIEEVYTEEEG